MNRRFLSVLVFAFVIAAGASLLVYRLVASRMDASVRPAATKTLLASHELPVGTMIKDVDVQIAEWGGPIPPNALTKQEDAIGRGVVATIYPGEPIVQDRLAARGAGAGLAATIPMGMRAVAVRVNEVVGLAGFVVPGMRVDVLIAGAPPGNTQGGSGTLSKTLLQNIQVLSAGQKIEKNNDGRPESVGVVNLLVTPEQAEIMSLASNETRIQLVLRNPLDTKETKTPGTATANLFSGIAYSAQALPAPVHFKRLPAPKTSVALAATPVAQPERNRAAVVEMIHGAKKTEESFQQRPEKP